MAIKKNTDPARKEDLIIQRMGDEVIVYDRSSHRAHSLNRTAALVFEKLDGKHDLATIARHVGKEVGKEKQDEIVASAVNDLAAADLLRPGAMLPRRAALRGLAAALLPVVITIAVPTAASAGSCVDEGGLCDQNIPSSTCCAGLDCLDVGCGFPDFRCVSYQAQ